MKQMPAIYKDLNSLYVYVDILFLKESITGKSIQSVIKVKKMLRVQRDNCRSLFLQRETVTLLRTFRTYSLAARKTKKQ